MRFRATITDPHLVRRFDTILTAASKMSKECVLRITQDRVYVISSEAISVVVKPTAWAEIDKDKLFDEYNMDGVSEEENEIYVEFSPDTLHKNLTTLKSSSVRGLKVKLTKKNTGPNLTFEVKLGLGLTLRQVNHDVPVQLVPRKYWSDYAKPILPTVNVSLLIGDLKRFRTLLEKIKSFGNFLSITGYSEGSLMLSIQTDEVKISGRIKNLKAPVLRPGHEPWSMEEMESATVRVDIKRLNHFITAEMINPERVVMNLVDNEMIFFLLVAPEISYQIFIPKTDKH